MKITWTRSWQNESWEYLSSNGARVYRYEKKPFCQEWGVQLPTWKTGDGGFRSMKEAKEFVRKLAEES